MAGPEGPPAPQGQPNKSQGPGAFGPRPWLSGRFAPSRRLPPGPRRFCRRQKWPGGREGRQDGTRPGPAPWGKAAAHGLRAAAAGEDGRGRPPWGGHCPWGATVAVRAAPPCAQHGQIFMHTSQARQITVRRLPTDLASPTRCTLREAGKRGLGS